MEELYDLIVNMIEDERVLNIVTDDHGKTWTVESAEYNGSGYAEITLSDSHGKMHRLFQLKLEEQ